MRRQVFFIISTFLLMLTLLTSCGKTADSAEEISQASDVVLTESPTDIPAAEEAPPAESFVPADEVPSDGKDSELPEYLQINPVDQTALIESANAGEGVSSLAGEAVTLKPDAEEKELGETVTVKTQYGDYELTVESVSLTNERHPEESETIPYVVLLRYTYKNTAYSDSFLLGDVSFKVVNDKNLALGTYAFSDVPDAAHPAAEPVEKGESAEVSQGYVLYEKTTRIRVIFDDLTDENGVEYYWDVDV